MTALVGSPRRIAGSLAVAAGAFVILSLLPGRIDRGPQEIVLNLLIWVAVAQAWNLIGGIGGQLSLGHAVFVGTGGYTVAMLVIKAAVGWPLALVGGAVVSGLLAWALSYPLLRLSGVFFTIGTSAVAIATLAWMVTWEWTGESRGLNMPLDAVPDRVTKFRVVAVVAVLTCLTAYLMLQSTFGLRLMAIRDDESAAAQLGVSPARVKRQAFVLSAVLTGAAGGVIALNQVSIEPNSMFGLKWTVTALVMVIVGGMGTMWGPVIGAFVIYYLVDRSLEDQPVVQALLSGALVIAVIVVAPDGVGGLLRSGWTWLRGVAGANWAAPDRKADTTPVAEPRGLHDHG